MSTYTRLVPSEKWLSWVSLSHYSENPIYKELLITFDPHGLELGKALGQNFYVPTYQNSHLVFLVKSQLIHLV